MFIPVPALKLNTNLSSVNTIGVRDGGGGGGELGAGGTVPAPPKLPSPMLKFEQKSGYLFFFCLSNYVVGDFISLHACTTMPILE